MLQHIDFSYNRLTFMPEELFNIKTLKRIHLEKNHVMEGVIPESIGDLVNLEVVTLHNNLLSGRIPSSIKKCVKLRELSVHHNIITGDVEGFLEELCSLRLETLFLNNNQIDFVDVAGSERMLREGGNYKSFEKLCLQPQFVEDDDSGSEFDETTEMTLDGTHTTEGGGGGGGEGGDEDENE